MLSLGMISILVLTDSKEFTHKSTDYCDRKYNQFSNENVHLIGRQCYNQNELNIIVKNQYSL